MNRFFVGLFALVAGCVLSSGLAWANTAPTPADDAPAATQNASTVLDVLSNDTDPEGDALTVVSITQPATGSAVLNADGTITYTVGDWYGGDSFTYTVSDPLGASATATVNVQVNPQLYPVMWVGTVNVTTNTGGWMAKNAGGNNWNAGGRSGQTITGDGGMQVTVGAWTFVMSVGLSASKTSYSVNSLNYGFYFGNSDTVQVREPGVLINLPTRVAGEVFRVERRGNSVVYLRNGAVIRTSPTPSSGALIVDGSIYTQGRGMTVYTYAINRDTTPPAISQGAIATDPQTVIVRSATDEYARHTVRWGVASATENQKVVNTGATGHVDALTGLSADTTYTYQVEATDGWGNTAISPEWQFTTDPQWPVEAVTWAVIPGAGITKYASSKSILADGGVEFIVPASTSFTVGLDKGISTSNYFHYGFIVGGSSYRFFDNGSLYNTYLTIPNQGGGTNTFRVERIGTDMVYSINGVVVRISSELTGTELYGATTTTSLSATMSFDHTAPVASDLPVSTDEDTAAAFALPVTDAEGDALTYELVSAPAHGGVVIAANGTATYTPGADYNGADSFSYRASDSWFTSNTGTVSVTVNPVNDAPVMGALSAAVIDETGMSVISASAFDMEGDALTYAADCDGNGTFESGLVCSYPDNGIYPVPVQVSDGALTDTGVVEVTVNNVAPVIVGVAAPIVPQYLSNPVTVSVGFGDVSPADTTFTVSYIWDEDNPASPVDTFTGVTAAWDAASGMVLGSHSASHTYAENGGYSVEVVVTDKDGGVVLQQHYFITVYDESQGHITAGGWFSDITGTVRFGFASVYPLGQTTSTMHGDIHHDALGIDFHMNPNVEWVVLANDESRFTGTGYMETDPTTELNFMLSMIDADQPNAKAPIDAIRVKIWQVLPDTSEVVLYDSQPGEGNSVDPTAVLDGVTGDGATSISRN
ncbi:MAG: Ig-like domain-containing protein [Nitrospirota bacterium]|nr:Ig-like domain-containing protein [Nitrospirota bacterium]